MGATFNLNSGMFGQKDMIGRIGNIGWKITSAERYKKSHHFIKYTKSYRIPKDEVRQVYEGFEVASHGWHHNDFRTASREKTKTSILQDKKNLEKIFGTAISGFAYPFGAAGKAPAILRQAGIRYARTVKKAASFDMPADLLMIQPTGWHIEKEIMQKLDRFIAAEADDADLFFLMGAHGYEFDFDTPESNWEKLRRICDKVAGRQDIICCSTAEALGFSDK